MGFLFVCREIKTRFIAYGIFHRAISETLQLIASQEQEILFFSALDRQNRDPLIAQNVVFPLVRRFDEGKTKENTDKINVRRRCSKNRRSVTITKDSISLFELK